MKKILLSLTALALLGGLALAQVADDTYVEMVFAEADTLDPVQAYDSASGQIIENVYENLYRYAGDSVTEYEPALATGYEVSEDGLTYTFDLREDVTFHSGNPFTCRDVEYSMERAVVTNPPGSGAWILAEPFTGTGAPASDALGEGATDADYQEYWNMIDSSVECPDDMTVQFTLQQVDPAFFTKLLFYAAAIVDSQWAIENGMWDGTQETWRDWIGVDLHERSMQSAMSGTGPYQLVEWAPGTNMVLESNENYWGGAPEIKNVVIQLVEDESAHVLAIQQGDADRVSLERASLGQVRGSPGVVVMDAAENPDLGWSSVTVSAVFMDQEVAAENNPYLGSGQLDGNGIPPDFFTDVNVRRCFNYSFDRDAFIDQVLQGAGNRITMALPPSYLGYDPTIPTYELDLEAAEEACRAAWDGQLWENGFELTIAYNSGNESRQAVGEILKSNLEFLNPKFSVNVQGLAWPDYLGARNASQLPVSVSGWIPDYADPDNYIHTFYASDGFYGDQMGLDFEQIDELDQQARTETDPAAREFLYSQIGHLAHELAPYILLPQGTPFMVLSDELQGTYLNPMLSGDYLWMDLSKQ